VIIFVRVCYLLLCLLAYVIVTLDVCLHVCNFVYSTVVPHLGQLYKLILYFLPITVNATVTYTVRMKPIHCSLLQSVLDLGKLSLVAQYCVHAKL